MAPFLQPSLTANACLQFGHRIRQVQDRVLARGDLLNRPALLHRPEVMGSRILLPVVASMIEELTHQFGGLGLDLAGRGLRRGGLRGAGTSPPARALPSLPKSLQRGRASARAADELAAINHVGDLVDSQHEVDSSITDQCGNRVEAKVARQVVAAVVEVVEAQRRVVDPGRGDLLAATHRLASAFASTRRNRRR